MMNALFCFMVLASIIFGALCGRMSQVSQALLEESKRAIELSFSLMGSFCLWGGMMSIAQQSGLTKYISKGISPVTTKIFKGLDKGGEAIEAIALNLTANLLGLGNAATPLGITAMKEMEKEEGASGIATNNMALFVVMNTASLQLIPTTTALLRATAGSKAPLDILPAVWLASAVSITCGIISAKILALFFPTKPKTKKLKKRQPL